MKLNKETLKQIIKEEMDALLNEMSEEPDMEKAKKIASDTRNMGDMMGLSKQQRIDFIVNMYAKVSKETAAAAVKLMRF